MGIVDRNQSHRIQRPQRRSGQQGFWKWNMFLSAKHLLVIVIVARLLSGYFCFAGGSQSGAPGSADSVSSVTLRFKSKIRALDTKEPESVEKGIEAFRTCYSGSQKNLADRGYFVFRSFFNQVIASQTDLLIKGEGCYKNSIVSRSDISLYDFQKGFQRQSAKFRKDECLSRLFKCGMCLFSSEGDLYVGERSGFLLQAFSPFVSADVSVYLKIRDKELRQGFQDDSALEISFRDLSQRVWKWEKYLEEHPESVLAEEADYYYRLYLSVLLTGLANTPAFNMDSNRLEKKTIAVYKDFINEHPASKTSAILKKYLELLRASNYRFDNSIPAFLKENGLELLLNVQLPTR